MKKVAFISQPEYFSFIYEDLLADSSYFAKEFSFNFDMTKEDFSELVNFKADYNFFFRGEFFPDEVLSKLEGVKVALSSEPFPRKINEKWEYTKDSIKRYLIFRKIREKKFDFIFHYDKASFDLFKKDKLFISGDFPFPVSVKTYQPMKEEKKWDFFFIGRSTPHREKFFIPLKHKFNFLHIAHGVWGKDLVSIINKSKICLNIHAEPEISWEPRTQMLMACGAFVISEPITSNDYIRPGVDYIIANNPQDLFEKASFYLENDAEREKIAQSARNRILELFDSKRRFKELIEKIEKGSVSRFKKHKKGHPLFYLLELLKRKK